MDWPEWKEIWNLMSMKTARTVVGTIWAACFGFHGLDETLCCVSGELNSSVVVKATTILVLGTNLDPE